MVLFIYIKLFLCYYNHIKIELVSQVLGEISEEEQNILRKRFGDDLGIIVIIRKATNKLFFDFILNKELYEEGVYDFYINSNNPETYIDDFNMSFRKK